MGAARPPHGRPRQATPLTRTLRQPPCRPRRWRRPLAAGLALVLIAVLVPGALADEGGTGAAPGGAEATRSPRSRTPTRWPRRSRRTRRGRDACVTRAHRH